ncbi:hypothetical protein ACWT_4919 [Actinoplanes sp. SE50]|uniref:hypothetical protein n=1 Tax=unclassified Actinoplanes TaxID=2626549 RepID=UPI00023EC826|nr:MULTISPECIES: hypothetical protein [unclassified Actinoplanes]AEV85938.1 hypothetical protein ACPL_5049 [Actinoplanes sp. SE50/110]ATO84334.1 hypothetical protein ACWT_4919 [Actinoplanes sp. SE50]SLM01744.1 hypothetical protein ACSP50_4982 [Actinoplanes sp. SE50/110]
MTSDDVAYERRGSASVIAPVQPRKLAKVPFVELADGRLQGVVSSGSDIERVYVSSITVGDHGLSCNTNNNRPCGGLSGGTRACNHLRALVEAAVAQYGAARVARYLSADDAEDLWAGLHPVTAPNRAAEVFSGFLRHLAYLEVEPTTDPLPELQWFPAAAAVR